MPRHSEDRSFVTALVLVALAAGAFIAYARWLAPAATRPAPGHETEKVAEITPATSAPRPANARVIATVYECHGPNGRVLSDAPCAKDARVREVLEPNSMSADAAPQAPSSQRPTSVQPSRHLSEPISPDNRRRCADIDAEIDRINARMRHAYTNSEGEYLRERLRALSAERWNAKCGH